MNPIADVVLRMLTDVCICTYKTLKESEIGIGRCCGGKIRRRRRTRRGGKNEERMRRDSRVEKGKSKRVRSKTKQITFSFTNPSVVY